MSMATKKRQRVNFRVNFNKNAHEYTAWDQGEVVCGIDEVGRGCLAGPLVTAAVILPPHKNSRLVKDSKLLPLADRLRAHTWISKKAWVGYGIVNHRTIDSHNIWQATLIAMKRALINLLASSPYKPKAILVDAMPLKLLDTDFRDIPIHHFPKGERYSSSIAAASIMAKIKRDELMNKLDPLFPGYFLGQHKGYSTQKHMESLKSLNRSIIHRLSFVDNMLNPDLIHAATQEGQQNLFESAENNEHLEFESTEQNEHQEFDEEIDNENSLETDGLTLENEFDEDESIR